MVDQVAALSVIVDGIENGHYIPERFARCVPDGKGMSGDGENIRPSIRWSGAPDGTKSYVIIVVDPNVPTRFESVNQEGKIVAADLPRKNFYHWLQAGIPANVTSLPEGQAGKVRPGISGQNSFGAWSASGGIGYDGPCPPWNDELIHHYHFIVYALGVPSLGLAEKFTSEQAENAMEGNILAKGEVVGVYTLNPKN